MTASRGTLKNLSPIHLCGLQAAFLESLLDFIITGLFTRYHDAVISASMSDRKKQWLDGVSW